MHIFHNTWLVLVSVLVFVLVSVPVSVLEFSLTNHDSLHGLGLGLGPGLCPGLRLCLCPSLWSGLCLGVCPGLCPGICSGLCKGLCPGLCLRSQDRAVTKKQAEACSGLNLFPPASLPQMNRRRGRKPRRIKTAGQGRSSVKLRSAGGLVSEPLCSKGHWFRKRPSHRPVVSELPFRRRPGVGTSLSRAHSEGLWLWYPQFRRSLALAPSVPKEVACWSYLFQRSLVSGLVSDTCSTGPGNLASAGYICIYMDLGGPEHIHARSMGERNQVSRATRDPSIAFSNRFFARVFVRVSFRNAVERCSSFLVFSRF